MTDQIDTVTENEIALVLDRKDLPVLFRQENGLDPIIAEVERRARSHKADVSTKVGRKAVASVAYEVAKSKTELDRRGKELNEDAQKQIAIVNIERKRYWARLEALQDEVRKPLDEWEAAEKARVDRLQLRMGSFDTTEFSVASTVADLAAHIAALELVEIDATWDEFEPLADDAKKSALDRLKTFLAAATVREDQAAENERLKAALAEREAQDRADREAQEARDRADADARQQEATKQQRLLDEQAAQIAELRRQAEARDAEDRQRKQAEEDAKVKAEQDRLAKIEDDRLAAERAERQRQAEAAEAEAREKRLAQEAEDRKRREAEIADKAREDERNRLAEERRQKEAEDNRRAADAKRRAGVKAEIIDALAAMAGEATPVAIADALIEGRIPHVTVTF